MTDVLLGDDYILQATITDINGNPVTPTSQVADLYDPNQVLKDTDNAPTPKGSGIYWAYLDIPVDGIVGIWEVVWTINVSGIIDSEKHYFKVKSNP